MINKCKNIIFSKTNLILYWFSCLFFQHFVTQLLLPESLRSFIWHGLWVIDILWVTILIIYDIYKKQINFKDKKILFLIIFVLFTTVSWIFKQPNHGPYYIFTLVTLYEQAFIFYLYALEANPNEFKTIFVKLAYIFIGFISFYTIASLICYISGNTNFVLPNGTEINMLGIDNDLAHKIRFMGLWTWYTVASFDCYIAILLSLYLIDNNKNKIFHYIMILLNSYLIYLTDSRSSLIILAFIFLCFILFLMSKKLGFKKSIGVGILCILLGILGLFVLKISKNPSLFAQFMNNPWKTLTKLSSGRIQMAEGIIANLKNTWLLGNGYCNNDFVLQKYGIQHPHNLIMALLLYTGIPGLILFVIFLVCNILAINKNIKSIYSNNMKWIFILVLCLLIESMFDICIIGAPVNIQTLYFWLCLGLIANKDVKTNEQE